MSRRREQPEGAELSFEEALEQLESLVARLEDGEQSLEQSLETFERGVRLVRLCSERLEAAQVRLRELEAGPDGPREADLELEGDA